jgi:DMSO reductase anchor subunit
MHPAYSVIIFTTASGAGYGLLFLLGLSDILGLDLRGRWFMPVSLTLALGLVAVGLLSSTFHLGRPERAWRAFSQWRSSWLSREGVAAMVTFVPAGILWLVALLGDTASGASLALGLAAAVLSVITVYCTAMIYASLKTIRQWHNGWVAPAYLSLALASGAVLLVCLTALFGGSTYTPGIIAVVTLLAAYSVKLRYWLAIDTVERSHTMQAATGLENARQIAPPHTSANYVMKEMGFQVARKHARKLRRLAALLGFVLPAVACLIAAFTGQGLAIACGFVAVASCAAGLFIERWLFFGEARHVVRLFYGEAAV